MSKKTISNEYQKDARRDQMIILKLEHRHLRPTAELVLRDGASKKKKILAVAALSALLASLSPAPQAFASKLGLPDSVVNEALTNLDAAQKECDRLCGLLNARASQTEVKRAIGTIMGSVDQIHSRLEKGATQSGARLIGIRRTYENPEHNAAGTGGGNDDEEKTNVSWLSRLKV